MSNAYQDINRSLLAYCNNFLIRHDIKDVDIFDFDAHAVEQELPDQDLIGIGEYSIENQTDKYHVTCMFIVCTKADDTQLKRLRNLVGSLFAELRPQNSGEPFKIVDEAGLKRGYMTVMDNVLVGPVGSNKTRPVQAIAVAFGVGYASLPI